MAVTIKSGEFSISVDVESDADKRLNEIAVVARALGGSMDGLDKVLTRAAGTLDNMGVSAGVAGDQAAEAAGDVDDLADATERATDAADDNADATDDQATGFTRLQKAVVVANQALELAGKIIRGVTTVVDSTVGKYADFETALTGVAKTSDLSTSQLDMFGETMLQLSTRIPVAANDLLGLAEVAGTLGVTGTEDLEKFSETAARIGFATNLGAEEAGVAFAKILEQTNNSVKNIDRLGSAIVSLGNTFKTNEKQITSMALAVAGSTAQFDLSTTQVVGLSTALSTLGGVAPELASSATLRAFDALNNAVRGGGVALDTLARLTGSTSEEIQQDFAADALGVLQRFVRGLADEGRGAADALRTMELSGVGVTKVLVSLGKQSDNLDKALSQASEQYRLNTALQKESEAAFKTLNAAWEIFLNTVSLVAVRLGAVFAPAAEAVLNGITALANGVGFLVQVLEALAPAILLVATAFAAWFIIPKLTVAVLAYNAAILLLTGNMVGLSIALTAIKTKLMASAVGFVVAAKGAIVLAAPLVLVALKFIAIAAAVVLVGSAIEIIIRNFDKLDVVLEVAKTGFLLFVNGLQMAWQKVKGFFTDTSAETAKLQKEQSALLAKIKKDADGVDFGVTGDSIEKITKLFGGMGESAKKAGAEAAKAAKAGEGVNVGAGAPAAGGASEEAQKNLDDLIAKTKEMNQAQEEIGKSQVELIRLNGVRFNQELNGLEKSLAATNALGEEQKKQIALARQTRASLDQAKIDEMRKKTLEDITKETDRLANAELMAGLSAVDKVRKKLELDLKALDVRREQLKADGLLTKEIDKQIKKQSELLKAKGGKDVKEAKEKKREKDPGAIVSAGDLTQMGDVLGAGVGGAIGGALAAFNPAGAFMAVANMITGAIQSLIDFGPNFINAIADIFNSLTDLPNKLLEAMLGLFDSIINFLTNFLSNVGNMIVGLLDGFADFLLKIPDVLVGLVDSLPSILENILSALPEIAQKLVMALVQLGPTLMTRLAIAAVKVIPKLMVGFVQAIPLIVNGIIDGFIEGIKTAVNEISNALGLGDVFNIDVGPAMEQLSDLSDTISRSASKVFNVADLEAQAKGLTNAENIGKAIESATKKSVNWLKKMWDALTAVWRWVWTKILKPIIDAIRAVWLFVWKKILKPIIDAIREVWLFVWKKIIKPIADVIGDAFKAVVKILEPVWKLFVKLVKPVFKLLQTIGKALAKLWGNAFKIFKIAGEAVFKLLKNVFKIFEAAGKAVGKLIKAPIDFLKKTWKILMDVFSGKISVLDGVRKLFRAAFDMIATQLKAVAGFFQTVFNVAKDNFSIVFNAFKKIGAVIFDNLKIVFEVFKKIGQAYMDAWKKVIEGWKKVGEGLVNIFKKVFEGFGQIGAKLGEGLKQVFSKLGEIWTKFFSPQAIVGVFKQAFNALKNVFGNLFDNFNLDGLKNAFSKMFNALNPQNLLSKMFNIPESKKGKVEKLIGIDVPFVEFAEGGLVPGSGNKDTVPALLTPGEFVIPKGIMQAISGGGIGVGGFDEKAFTAGLKKIASLNVAKAKREKEEKAVEKIIARMEGEGRTPEQIEQFLSIRRTINGIVEAMKRIPPPPPKKKKKKRGIRIGGDVGKFTEGLKKAGGGVSDAFKRSDVGKVLGEVQNQGGKILEKAKKEVSVENVKKGLDRIGSEFSKLFDPVKKFFKMIVRKTAEGLTTSIKGTSGRAASGDTGRGRALALPATAIESAVSLGQRMEKGDFAAILKQAESGAFAQEFANGGIVRGTGTDGVPITAHPGEFVVNRRAAQANMQNLQFLNKTGNLPNQGSSGGDTILNVTINAKTMLGPEQIRREVVPVIEKEFRRSSMRGKFLLSTSGTRDNR